MALPPASLRASIPGGRPVPVTVVPVQCVAGPQDQLLICFMGQFLLPAPHST